ncbi:MAG: DUF2283 domain-containing protein [Desulfobacteraceae bacterium]|nr:DUF2283 domain-containing protein [Desulfobacteraceae bacterium]
MKFSYDPKYNIAYIRLRPKSDEVVSIKISDEFIVDLAPDGTVYGIELLNANEQLMQADNGRFLFCNEHNGHEVELSLDAA